MPTAAPTLLLDGLVFPEGPRWREGKLWFSDMFGGKVMTVDLAGNTEVVATVPQRPSGLGFLPDGRLLIVSMGDRRLLRLDPDDLRLVADLTDVTGGDCNDMLVDALGRAYIGNFGYDLAAGEQARPTNLVMVTPDGDVRVVASDLVFPNGMVITPNGKTLIVAETFGNRLTAFDIAGDGTLSKRRVFAELGVATPDGICLDAEGAVWVASFRTGEFLRVYETGSIRDRIAVPGKSAVACMLGGDDRCTLFLLTAEGGPGPDSKGYIETVRVDVPGAGWP
jgi:sugar lactone lactonase YvrE